MSVPCYLVKFFKIYVGLATFQFLCKRFLSVNVGFISKLSNMCSSSADNVAQLWLCKSLYACIREELFRSFEAFLFYFWTSSRCCCQHINSLPGCRRVLCLIPDIMSTRFLSTFVHFAVMARCDILPGCCYKENSRQRNVNR